MPFVTANGIAHHVQELGAGATPLVMVHGLLIGSLASWYFTAGPPLARTRSVRMYDLRGHGRSDRAPAGYDTATLGAVLAALTHDLPAFDLGGPSGGGLVAWRFALAHPARVRRLVVVEAPLPPSSALELASCLSADVSPATLLDALPESLRTAVASGRRQAARLASSVIALVRDTTLLADLRAEPDPTDAQLAMLQPPTLCLYGDRSACRPAADRLARVAPRARSMILSGGHYLHLDARDAMIEAIESHLDG